MSVGCNMAGWSAETSDLMQEMSACALTVLSFHCSLAEATQSVSSTCTCLCRSSRKCRLDHHSWICYEHKQICTWLLRLHAMTVQQHARLILRRLSCLELNLMFAGQLGSIIKELLLAESNAHGSPINSIIHHLVSVSFPRSGFFPGFAPMCDLPSRSFCSVD